MSDSNDFKEIAEMVAAAKINAEPADISIDRAPKVVSYIKTINNINGILTVLSRQYKQCYRELVKANETIKEQKAKLDEFEKLKPDMAQMVEEVKLARQLYKNNADYAKLMEERNKIQK